MRKALVGDYPIWDGKTVESLEKHHQFWTFERKSFEAHLPDEPVANAPVSDGSIPKEPISSEPVSRPLTVQP